MGKRCERNRGYEKGPRGPGTECGVGLQVCLKGRSWKDTDIISFSSFFIHFCERDSEKPLLEKPFSWINSSSPKFEKRNDCGVKPCIRSNLISFFFYYVLVYSTYSDGVKIIAQTSPFLVCRYEPWYNTHLKNGVTKSWKGITQGWAREGEGERVGDDTLIVGKFSQQTSTIFRQNNMYIWVRKRKVLR